MVATNQGDLAFDEDLEVIVDLITPVAGQSGIGDITAMEITTDGVFTRRTVVTGSAPDPVTTTEHTWFVPWSNVKALKQTKVIS